MALRRRARAAAQNILIVHPFAVVFAECARRGAISGIRFVTRTRPLPYVAEWLEVARTAHRMKMCVFHEIPCDIFRLRRDFPFGFGGQTRPFPARERVGLEIRNVTNRFVAFHFANAAEREHLPRVFIARPVKRRLNMVLLNPVPARRKPKFRASITVFVDELQPFAARRQALEISNDSSHTRWRGASLSK
jgi:hypothetical protein